MREILPGLWHWRVRHPRIGKDVSSWFLGGPRVLIDPMEPEEGVERFRADGGVSDVLLSNRHHYRDSGAFVEAYGCTVHCHRDGLHEFGQGTDVRGFEPGDQLPGGVIACEVGVLCPDETALHVPDARALVIADGVVEWEPGDPLGFVPDSLLGDDPEAVRAGLTAAYRRLAEELDFDHLLLAHGEPVIGDGREQLRAFLG